MNLREFITPLAAIYVKYQQVSHDYKSTNIDTHAIELSVEQEDLVHREVVDMRGLDRWGRDDLLGWRDDKDLIMKSAR